MIATEETTTTRYRKDQNIQSGSGSIYGALDTASNTKVVLREFPIAMSKIMSLGQQEADRAAFTEKAQVLTNIKHESIQSTLDFFSDVDRHCLVLESIAGNDLAELLEKKKWAFPLHDVVNWADQLLEALHYLHTYLPPLYHHDIKPQNLKLTPGGKIKLLGLGFNNGTESSGTDLNYKPLEQIWGGLDTASQKVITNSYDDRAERLLRQPPDSRSDIYGVGASLYHLLTGSAPVDALERSIDTLEGKPDPLRSPAELDAGVPPEISDVVMRALELRRENRFDSSVIMRQVLRTSLVRMKEREALEAVEQEKLNTEWEKSLAAEEKEVPAALPERLHLVEEQEKQQVDEQARIELEAEQVKLQIEEQMQLDLKAEQEKQKIEEQMWLDLEVERTRIEDEQKIILRKRLDDEAEKQRQEELHSLEQQKNADLAADLAQKAELERAARRAEVERLLAEEHAAAEARKSLLVNAAEGFADSDPLQPPASLSTEPDADDDLLELPPVSAPRPKTDTADQDIFLEHRVKGRTSWWIPAAAVLLIAVGGGFFGLRSFMETKTSDLDNQAAPAMSVSPRLNTEQPAESIQPPVETAPATQTELTNREGSTDATTQTAGKGKPAAQPQPQPTVKKPAAAPAKTPAPKKAVTVDDLLRDN
jgi:serine/threonine protein kinase